jgi:hypothetical protein
MRWPMPVQQEARRVSHIARNPNAVGAKGDRMSLCGRIVSARELSASPAVAGCCAQCQKAWLTRWPPAAARPATRAHYA